MSPLYSDGRVGFDSKCRKAKNGDTGEERSQNNTWDPTCQKYRISNLNPP